MDIMLFVMLNRGDLSENEFEKLNEGFATGNYSFAESEVSAIIQRMLSVNTKAYLYGLFTLAPDGNTIAPKDPILDFIKSWKSKYGLKEEDTLFQNVSDENLYELKKTFAAFLVLS